MLDRFLALSDELRPGFSTSLGVSTAQRADSVLTDSNPLPTFLRTIYSQVEGTVAEIKEQSLLDLVPGYRLIHFSELQAAHETCAQVAETREFIPFLANYSSDFVCWKQGQIFGIAHDWPAPCLMHETTAQFYDTICDFYEKAVYFLDEYGYLDSRYERERIIGATHNHGVTYWQEV